jgi:hypothetical protein
MSEKQMTQVADAIEIADAIEKADVIEIADALYPQCRTTLAIVLVVSVIEMKTHEDQHLINNILTV